MINMRVSEWIPESAADTTDGARAQHAAAVDRLPSGRHNLSREFVLQSQHERLYAAMLSAVAEKGYADTSVADIVDLAKVSRATFYELFADKEQCFLSTYDQLTAQTYSYVARAYDAADTWPEKIEAALRALLRFLSANPDIAKVALVEVLAAGDLARQRHRETVRRFLPFADAGRAESPVGAEPAPPDAGLVVVGGVMHAIFEQVAAGRASELPRLLPDLVFVVTTPYLGPERGLALMERARAPR
jgi:AcrR family transcriptional regulator